MQRYRLRVPFRLACPLTEAPDPSTIWEIGPLQARLESVGPFVVLTVEPFADEAAARDFIPQVWGSLAWLAIRDCTGFSFDREVAELIVSSEEGGERLASMLKVPNRVDATADGNRPSIVPVGTKVAFMTGCDVNLTVSTGASRFVDALLEGLRRPGLSSALSDVRLRTGVELLTRAYHDDSAEARLLTITSALELLSESQSQSKHEVTRSMLSDFQARVQKARDAFPHGSAEWEELDELASDALFRSKSSITSNIRRLALDVFAGSPDAEARAENAVFAYKCRSKLTHRGRLDRSELDRALPIAQDTLQQALLVRMERSASASQSIDPHGMQRKSQPNVS